MSICLSDCLSICLSHARSRERDIVAPHFLHQHEELRLASCTNHFSSRYDTLLERERLWKFFRGYALTAVYPRKNFRLRWARSIPTPVSAAIMNAYSKTHGTLSMDVRSNTHPDSSALIVNVIIESQLWLWMLLSNHRLWLWMSLLNRNPFVRCHMPSIKEGTYKVVVGWWWECL